MKFLLNYATAAFADAQKTCSETALSVGEFDVVRSFGPNDLDEQFRLEYDHILRFRRGAGYWLWKPYLIYTTLRSLHDGDDLFYCDSGAHFVASAEPLVALCRSSHQDVITFELPYLESQYTKRDAFVLMDCDSARFADTQQRLASFSIWRRSAASLDISREYLRFACDERILTDQKNTCHKPNYPGFRAHRHDQSILSLVAKKHRLEAFRDPSQFGNHHISRYANSLYDQIIQHTRRGRSRLRQWLAPVAP